MVWTLQGQIAVVEANPIPDGNTHIIPIQGAAKLELNPVIAWLSFVNSTVFKLRRFRETQSGSKIVWCYYGVGGFQHIRQKHE